MSVFGALFVARLEQAGYRVEKVESMQAAHTPLALQLTITSVAMRYGLIGCSVTTEVDATVDLYDRGKSLGSHAYHGQDARCGAEPAPENLSAAVRDFLDKAIPEVTASLSALKPNASQVASKPPSPSASSVARKRVAGCATRDAMAALTMEPPILQVGDISAFYVSVTNSRSTHDVSLFFNWALDSITLLQPHAISESGDHVEALSVDQALEKAGGADKAGGVDKLRAAESSSHYKPFLPVDHGEYREEPGLFSGTTIEGLDYRPCAFFPGCGHIPPFEEFEFSGGEFQSTNQEVFAEDIFRCPGPKCKKVYLEPQGWEKGYLFFPRGNYTALEITVEDCDQQGCRTPRHSETLRCQFNFWEGW